MIILTAPISLQFSHTMLIAVVLNIYVSVFRLFFLGDITCSCALIRFVLYLSDDNKVTSSLVTNYSAQHVFENISRCRDLNPRYMEFEAGV